jgi:Zn-dependent protease with chaperone function
VLTTGLLELLDDEEVAAAIAHEMGHLEAQTGAAVQGLNGCRSDLNSELVADALGTRILQKSGIPAEAMIRMLEKVRSSEGMEISCTEQIGERIRHLKLR